MHLLLRERASLDEDDAAEDLGLAAADIVFLSFSDGDVALVAGAAEMLGLGVATAALGRLRHPMSVDLFVEASVQHARIVVIRLLGGLDYWRYGAEEVAAACRRTGVALAIVAGCERDDPRLAGLSTIAEGARVRLEAMLREGGAVNAARALGLAASIARGDPDAGETALVLPAFGVHAFATPPPAPVRGRAALVFYRSHLHADDLAPLAALAHALAAGGIAVTGLFVASPKAADCAAFLRAHLATDAPDLVLNATAFSARDPEQGSPLDAAGRPVLQLVIAGSDHASWTNSARGLSPADLAMQVVLPELDGRLALPAIGCKADTPFGRRCVPIDDGVASAADRVLRLIALARTPPAARLIAIVLSDYPGLGSNGGHAIGHAVGLDGFASLAVILRILDDAGYRTQTLDRDCLVHMLTRAQAPSPIDDARYKTLFATLPAPTRTRIVAAHGAPVLAAGIRVVAFGNVAVAIQPARATGDRRATYHDADAPPCHDYVAFHLWLAHEFRADALVHLGTHGTLEWLPGKATALSHACMPTALLGGIPVIYPFIANNPGEAAVAKRRLGAVTIGHLTPPLMPARLDGEASAIEALLEEYAGADGLDRRRARLLAREILARADRAGLLAEAGAPQGASADDETALGKLDAYLCDIKELRIGDGLHVFGTEPAGRDALLQAVGPTYADALDRSAACERASLLCALDGRFVQPGPAGALSRGRGDVLPTGRNLTTIDPRALPTPSAVTLAKRSAADLLARHLQDEGVALRHLVLDLWGSASLRTGGEDLAIAFVLLGAACEWDEAGRLCAVALLSLAELGRPRVDVTLRISGVFRDSFATQIALFDRAVRLSAARDESAVDNPLAGATMLRRVFGSAPGSFGTGASIGEWQAASAFAYGATDEGTRDDAGLRAIVARADAFLHQQDHRETDILDGPEHAAHIGGFAHAASSAGALPALYHADISAECRIRTVRDEISRVVRGRLANPDWLASMRRHGYRGASEMARGVEALADFARTLPDRFDAQFELASMALLGGEENAAFLAAANPEALRAIETTLDAMIASGLWHPRRNDHARLAS